jgi:hypothetical protein
LKRQLLFAEAAFLVLVIIALCLFTRGAGGSAEVPLRAAAVTFFRFAGKK